MVIKATISSLSSKSIHTVAARPTSSLLRYTLQSLAGIIPYQITINMMLQNLKTGYDKITDLVLNTLNMLK